MLWDAMVLKVSSRLHTTPEAGSDFLVSQERQLRAAWRDAQMAAPAFAEARHPQKQSAALSSEGPVESFRS
jgi:hypothetical protein